MSKVADSFIEQRAKILAMVQFTSRPDLHVDPYPIDYGLDLSVRISATNQKPHLLKTFGVELKGTNQPLLKVEDVARRFRGKPFRSLPIASFPVIVLAFSMQDDNGYCGWRVEPILNDSSEPRLKVHETPSFAPFDRSSLGSIVDRVADWYDKLFAMLETA